MRITSGLGSQLDSSGHQNDRFGSEARRAFHDIGRCPGGIAGELYQARPVSQVDEDQSTEIPSAVNPATQPDLLPDLGAAETSGQVSSQRGCARLALAHR